MSATAKEPRKPYLPAMGHDRLLPLYDPLQRLLGMESVHRQLVDQARIQPDQRVLEFGCGTGNLAILIKRLHPHAEVVGIDPDPKALARPQRKAGREALSVQLDRGGAWCSKRNWRRSDNRGGVNCLLVPVRLRGPTIPALSRQSLATAAPRINSTESRSMNLAP
jgi:SAM-dependent methyltransferase